MDQQVLRQLRQLQDNGATNAIIDDWASLGISPDLFPEGITVPKDPRAAERILSMSLAELGNMTIDQAADMNVQMLEEPEAPVRAEPPASQTTGIPPKQSALAARIERARQARESLDARRPASEPGLLERRKQNLIRDAVAKIMAGNIQTLNIEEVEGVLQCYEAINERPGANDSDLRLKKLVEILLPRLQERASELRRKRAQTYTTRPL